jgi:predicted dehydrogenase
MDAVRFGVIGLGPRGRRGWLRILPQVDRARIVAVCDRIEPLLRDGAAAAGLSDEDAHRDHADLLARADVDAVAIAVETEYQPDLLVQAIEAGKHVICEVPLAYSVEDCWRIVLAVERSGRTLAMAEEFSYSPFVHAWRRLVADGLMGKVTFGEAQYIHGMTKDRYWIDAETGRRLSWEEARRNPNARKTRMWNIHHPIWYSPHSLGPLLRILDDRVVRVTCMATRRPSHYLEEVPLPDMEVALMHTAGDTIIRLAAGLVAPSPRPFLWWHLTGTKGQVETSKRGVGGDGLGNVGALLWLADHQMRTPAEVTWGFTDYQPGANLDLSTFQRLGQTSHGGLDFYPAHDFVESVAHDRAPAVDVYRAAEIAAASVLAGTSADQGSALLTVPDFRPGPHRPAGQAPA